MSKSKTNKWLDRLGYLDAERGLYSLESRVSGKHPYGSEIKELLNPDGLIRAKAVYDIDKMPSICFFEDDGILQDETRLKNIREKIWNQNLITIFLVLTDDEAICCPVNNVAYEADSLTYTNASNKGNFSKRDIDSGDIFERHPDWFSADEKVDQKLLKNLHIVISKLQSYQVIKNDAQYLMAQVLFVSYLQHRGIIGKSYRDKYGLGLLEELVSSKDTNAIVKLLACLKQDLNGDFLEPESSGSQLWLELPDGALDLISLFLQRVDLDSGQTDLWHYDFKYIPVELISGIYESFLSDEKQEFGAYYTPRNLANFVIDQAFSKSKNILKEKIYDGACGSGILLTTAYRRMLAFAQNEKDIVLSFKERSQILCENIFGSDVSLSACRVTSFSLYLSLLEGLTPNDIAELQENEKVKLPTLSKLNIIGGEKNGDFFSPENHHSNNKKFTLFLSNPPWVEPDGSVSIPSDKWAKENDLKIPRRQMAGAFMLRAKECLAEGGRFCFILPASIIAAKTSASFLKLWLEQNKLDTLINFGDLRKLLFSTAKQPCMVALGAPRKKHNYGSISFEEEFDYFVPKADVSFAFGRLTIHSSDRHRVNARLACFNNEIFTTLYWGTAKDISSIAEMRITGSLGDYIGNDKRWISRKGFHKKDSSVQSPESSAPLRSIEYLDARAFKGTHPLLDETVLSKFPDEIETVAKLPNSLMEIYKSPKIVFTDGITANRTIKASFSNKPFSFSSSIGVISGKPCDVEVMRFLSVYLHSKLAQYVLMLTAYQIIFERERVTLNDVKSLPFVHPDDHETPEKAWSIIKSVNKKAKESKNHQDNVLLSKSRESLVFDDEIFAYFGIGSVLRNRVEEITGYVANNIQPSSISKLGAKLPSTNMVNEYSSALMKELEHWRDLRAGKGHFKIKVTTNSLTVRGPVGIVSIEPSDESQINKVADDVNIDSMVSALLKTNIVNLEIHPNLHYVADIVFVLGDRLYLIKPLVSRFWLRSESYMDAQRIVQMIVKSQEVEL